MAAARVRPDKPQFAGRVCEVFSPGKFYLQQAESVTSLHTLNRLLDETYREDIEKLRLPVQVTECLTCSLRPVSSTFYNIGVRCVVEQITINLRDT